MGQLHSIMAQKTTQFANRTLSSTNRIVVIPADADRRLWITFEKMTNAHASTTIIASVYAITDTTLAAGDNAGTNGTLLYDVVCGAPAGGESVSYELGTYVLSKGEGIAISLDAGTTSLRVGYGYKIQNH